MTEKKKRQDTRLESEGAEFLVVGNLLINGIAAYKAYTQNPLYDVIAVNPGNNRTAAIQVKSRYATDSNKTFPATKLNCDFFVFALLNRGNRYSKKKQENIVLDPCYYIVPSEVVQKIHRKRDSVSVVRLKEIPKFEQYKNNWNEIKQFLESKVSQ